MTHPKVLLGLCRYYDLGFFQGVMMCHGAMPEKIIHLQMEFP